MTQVEEHHLQRSHLEIHTDTNKELNIASHEVAEKTAQEWATYPSDLARAHLDQIRIILDKEDPDYKN